MRHRDPTLAIAITLILLFILCLHAHAGENDRSVIHRSPPVYPALARQMRITGSVVLIISIAPDGSVGEIKVQSGHPLLIQAATDAVSKWRYSPAPQATESTVNVVFESH